MPLKPGLVPAPDPQKKEPVKKLKLIKPDLRNEKIRASYLIDLDVFELEKVLKENEFQGKKITKQDALVAIDLLNEKLTDYEKQLPKFQKNNPQMVIYVESMIDNVKRKIKSLRSKT